MLIPPYNPEHINMFGLGCPRFARRYSGDRKNLLLERNGAFAPRPGITSRADAKHPPKKKVPYIAFYSSRY
jgi:hypothetical protein